MLDTLEQYAKKLNNTDLNTLFAQDPHRKKTLSIDLGPLQLDYSHHRVNAPLMNALVQRAEDKQLSKAIHGLFNGDKVNQTESRAALHTAFRSAPDHLPHGELIKNMQEKMEAIVTRFHHHEWMGASGQPIRDIVHLGIGGSYWGPLCLLDALADAPTFMNVHCVAELDHHSLDDVLATLHPDTTAFIIASKSFTTNETMENAKRACAWLKKGLKTDITTHLLAITEQVDKAIAFGVDEQHILPMWDWVGGRYSIWSSMALPVCLRYGMATYWELLSGAKAMDDHFLQAPWAENMPMVLALLSYWSTQYCHMSAEVILPYPYRLRSIIPHLQQLFMESLGKACTLDGDPVEQMTGPMVWGCLGSQAQHTFNQWLQQSPCITPVEFIVPAYDKQLLAQGLAQSQALAFGDDHANIHARLTGNRPHHMIYLKTLDARTMGYLLALYEHKVFCFAMLLNINPFDQFGVEHSKKIARELLKQLQ